MKRAAAGMALALASCGGANDGEAKRIVRMELGAPALTEFRNLTSNADGSIVCGEVMASDRPGGGWRRFNAFVKLQRAAVAPPGGFTSAADKALLAEFELACE